MAPHFRRTSVRRGRGTPAMTAASCSTRCAQRYPICWPPAAPFCWCNPSSPYRVRLSRRWPAPDWTLKSLPTSGFLSGRCCRIAGAVAGGHGTSRARPPRRRTVGHTSGQAMSDNESARCAGVRIGAGDGAGAGTDRAARRQQWWNPTGSWSRSVPAAAARTIRCATPATGAGGAAVRSGPMSPTSRRAEDLRNSRG